MFIEDIVGLVNKFSAEGISKFEIEFENDKLYIYMDNYIVLKIRNGNVLYPMGPISNRKNMYRIAVPLEGTQFLADGHVYHTVYSYGAEKVSTREIVREEIERFVEDKYHNRHTLMQAVVRAEIEEYLKEYGKHA